MPEGYAKLLSSILDSSIWAEPDDVVRVWVTLLAMADRDGYVGASPSGIAHRSRTVSVARVNELLKKFQDPDPESRSEEFEGRRVKKVDRGFLIINYKKIRDMHADGAERARKRLWWEANKSKKSDSKSESPLDASAASGTLVYGSVDANGSGLDLKDSDLGSDARTVRRKKSPIDPPEHFTPTEATAKCAEKHGRNWKEDWEECRDWHLKKGTSVCDWQATLRTWMSKSNGFSRPKPSVSCPDYLQFTEKHRGLAKRCSIDINLAWTKFKANSKSSDRKAVDWSAAFEASLAEAVDRIERAAAYRANGPDAQRGPGTAQQTAFRQSAATHTATLVPETRPEASSSDLPKRRDVASLLEGIG